MYIPTTPEEIKKLGWNNLDVIIISGDAYIDSYYDGTAIIGKMLIKNGYKVGIISQPDISNGIDISRLGEPNLFWGVSAGCVDSMVANYTSLLKKKRYDDLTPGGENTKRPDRAVIKYVNHIKQYFKSSKPIIIGGVEASLRRLAHYDFWTDSIRRSILFDSKANYLLYGMADKTIVEFAEKIKNGEDVTSLRGLCYIGNEKVDNYIEGPNFDAVKNDKLEFIKMFHHFYQNNDPINAKGLCQKHDNRYLIQNPPAYYSTKDEMDELFELGFERDVHPYYKKMGKVKALDTIQFSINSHLGCYGECNFCAITVHQGRTIRSRSQDSIIREAKEITKNKNFKGIINDVGGPTANMYDNVCKVQQRKGSCQDKRCLTPTRCKSMSINHDTQIDLLNDLKQIDCIRKVFVGSGLRYDLVIDDTKSGDQYMRNLVNDHVSGQLKIAPEHISENVLEAMGKPANIKLKSFRQKFNQFSKEAGKKQFLTYYFIAAHPGCQMDQMDELNDFVKTELKLHPEQVQIFNPTPGTYSSVMYHTELNPFTLEPIYVAKGLKEKKMQKEVMTI